VVGFSESTDCRVGLWGVRESSEPDFQLMSFTQANFTEHIQTNTRKSSFSIENTFLGAVTIFSNITVIELK